MQSPDYTMKSADHRQEAFTEYALGSVVPSLVIRRGSFLVDFAICAKYPSALGDEAMPSLRRYRVFISHVWHRNEDYWRVVKFLNDAPLFDWENLSVPSHDPITAPDLEYQLRNEMRDADVFLIIAGMYAAYSEWIDFELNFARRIGQPVIGIDTWGSQRTPAAIQRGAREIVGWNGGSIVRAIRQHALPSG